MHVLYAHSIILTDKDEPMGKLNLDILTGKLAIGSLWILTALMVIDGFLDLFPFFEWMTKTKSWEVFVAVPAIVFAYIVGIVAIRLSSWLFSLIRRFDIEEETLKFVQLCSLNNGFIIEKHQALKNELELLQASVPPLALLAMAVLWYSRVLGSVRVPIKLLSVLTLFLTVIMLAVIKRVRTEMMSLMKNAMDMNHSEVKQEN